MPDKWDIELKKKKKTIELNQFKTNFREKRSVGYFDILMLDVLFGQIAFLH